MSDRMIDPTYQKIVNEYIGEVDNFIREGSYQGEWAALLKDGRIVSGSYGSCSGCDAIQATAHYGGAENDYCEYITEEEGRELSQGFSIYDSFQAFYDENQWNTDLIGCCAKAFGYEKVTTWVKK